MFGQRPRRLLAYAALSYGAGIWVGAALPMHWLYWAGLGLAALLIIALRLAGKRVFLGLMALCAFAGLINAAIAAHPAMPPPGDYVITATVTGEAQYRADDRVQTQLRDAVCVNGAGESYAVASLYWTYWPAKDDIILPLDGQTAHFEGSIYHPTGERNPFGFDFRMYLYTKGIVCGVTGCKELILTPAEQSRPSSAALRARQAIQDRLDLLLGEQSSMAKALLVGEKESMPREMAQGFRNAGIAHVLTVSGLHAMILMSALAALLRVFTPSPRCVLAVVSAAMLGYCALLGFSPAIVRACVMLFFLLLGRVPQRGGDGVTLLSAAFLAVLLFEPLQLFSPGFQMSFCAVLGIFVLGDAARPLINRFRSGTLKRRLAGIFLVSWAAYVGVSLPVMVTYNRLSLVGLVFNPLACLAVEVLMIVSVLLLLLSVFAPPAALWAGRAVAFAFRLFTGVVQGLGDVPFAAFNVPTPPWYVLLAFVFLLLLCTRYVRLAAKWRASLGLGALALSLAIAFAAQNRDVRYIQLSMGSADSAIILDGRRTIVIDCGEYSGDAASYLLATGRRADTVILSHLHSDHVLGLGDLLDAGIPIGRVCLPRAALDCQPAAVCMAVVERAREEGIPIQWIAAGDRIATDRVTIDVLWPDAVTPSDVRNANDFATALLVDLDGVRLLHMSDVPGVYENYVARRADVLLAAHHGSASSTYTPFLEAVRPDIALISTAKASDSTLQRLAQAGVMVYDTLAHGALTITARDGAYSIQGHVP